MCPLHPLLSVMILLCYHTNMMETSMEVNGMWYVILLNLYYQLEPMYSLVLIPFFSNYPAPEILCLISKFFSKLVSVLWPPTSAKTTQVFLSCAPWYFMGVCSTATVTWRCYNINGQQRLVSIANCVDWPRLQIIVDQSNIEDWLQESQLSNTQ